MAFGSDEHAAISSYSRVLAKALDERDGVTRRHCDRVVELSGALGRACRLEAVELRLLRLAAALHDVGKIGIPDYVLMKPTTLVGEEWEAMQSHPERGQRIVLSIGVDGVEAIGLAVRHHHENFDGGGYPDGLAGEHIPYTARMLAIADAYDAMGIPQPYQHRRSHEQIMDILDEEGGHRFDPFLLARFAAMIGHSSWKAPSA